MFNKIIGFIFLIVWSISSHAAVLATWDINLSSSGTMNCFPNACPTPPNDYTFTIGHDNHPNGPPISYTYLFGFEQLIDASSVGSSFIVNESNSMSNFYVNNFNYFVSRLTNGTDERLNATLWGGDVRQDDGSFSNSSSFGGFGYIPFESDALNKNYLSSSPDLENTTITSIEFYLSSLDVTTITPDPFSIEYAISLSGVFSAHGDVNPVPIPSAVWLFGSGLIGLIGLARRKKV